MCLVLHGLGANERTRSTAWATTASWPAPWPSGVPPFILASIDGGDGYWHPRASGDDPLGMLLEDFPVVLAQHGLSVETFALLGYSMGGYGALLAAVERPEPGQGRGRQRAGAVEYLREGRAQHFAGSFDSEDDWRQWGDMPPRLGRLKGIPLRVDCGESDPFEPALDSMRERLPDPAAVHITKGCHDNAYWRSVAPAQFELIGRALTPPPTTRRRAPLLGRQDSNLETSLQRRECCQLHHGRMPAQRTARRRPGAPHYPAAGARPRDLDRRL